MTSASSLYNINSEGWRSYNIYQLQKEQCDLIASNCKEEASLERYKAIALGVGSAFSATIFVIACFAVASAAAPFFMDISSSACFALGCPAPAIILLATKIFSYTTCYIIGLVVFKKMWDKASFSVSDHWKYASHLDQQALDVLLHKFVVSSMPVPSAPPEEISSK